MSEKDSAKEMNILGCTDIPLQGDQEDLLSTAKYINALVKFASECCTPMSIALQGDWGTGKTSFIYKMDASLKAKGIPTIYFNTWQYSQFNSSDLFTSFVTCIIEKLKQINKVQSVSFNSMLENLKYIGVDLAKQFLEKKVGFDLDVCKEVVENEFRRNNIIADMKSNFASMISETAGKNGRVVIFVDDLDRLNPDKAVELLEVMKLFMDVEKCVFVIAVDYEVVVKGIRKKYGSDMDDSKCRSFFDKIIQLPFRMPVENYDISNLIKKTFNNEFDGYDTILAKLIKNTLGPNPRTFKRLFNSYMLLSLVNTEVLESTSKVLLTCILIIQMYDLDAFNRLLEMAENCEVQKITESDNETLVQLSEAIDSIMRSADNDKKKANIYDEVQSLLMLSSVTTLNNSATLKKAAATQVSKIEVEGCEVNVSTATDAVVNTFGLLLSSRISDIDTILKDNQNILTTDEKNEKGIFAAKRRLDVKNYDTPIYIGTKTGYDSKISQVNKICKYLGIPRDAVKWYT